MVESKEENKSRQKIVHLRLSWTVYSPIVYFLSPYVNQQIQQSKSNKQKLDVLLYTFRFLL